MAHIYGVEADNAYVKLAAGIAKEVAGPAASDVDAKGRFPKECLSALQAKGLTGLTVPVEFGGKGQGPGVFCAVVEELAKVCASSAMIYVMHVSATAPIVASKTLAARSSTLKDIAAGRHLTTLAFSEKGSRSVFWIPVSKLDGDRTSAQKSWVTAASQADSYVSSAGLPGAKSPLESIVYLLDRKAPGVRVVSSFEGLGLRGNDSSPVTLEGVRVPKESLLCGSGKGSR